MKRLLAAGILTVVIVGCGGDVSGSGKNVRAGETLDERSSAGFIKLLEKETGEEEQIQSESARKIGRALALAKVETDVSPEKPESPTPESEIIRGKVAEVAVDCSWVTATFPEEASRPSVGDWAAVVERTPPDNTNPLLEIKRDTVMAFGRVLELQGQTAKIQLDKASIRPRIQAGQEVIIRWF